MKKILFLLFIFLLSSFFQSIQCQAQEQVLGLDTQIELLKREIKIASENLENLGIDASQEVLISGNKLLNQLRSELIKKQKKKLSQARTILAFNKDLELSPEFLNVQKQNLDLIKLIELEINNIEDQIKKSSNIEPSSLRPVNEEEIPSSQVKAISGSEQMPRIDGRGPSPSDGNFGSGNSRTVQPIPQASGGKENSLDRLAKEGKINNVRYSDFCKLIAQKFVSGGLTNIEDSRVDKQAGGDSSLAGSTSLVQKGNSSSIFSFAVENGALTQTVSGTNITFRGNPVGIIRLFSKYGFGNVYSENYADPFLRHLGRISFSVTFEANRGKSDTSMVSNNFTGDLKQVSAFSFRYNFLDQRDPRNARYIPQIADFVRESGGNLLDGFDEVSTEFTKEDSVSKWIDETNKKLSSENSVEKRKEIIKKQLEVFPYTKLSSSSRIALEKYAQRLREYLDGQSKLNDIFSRGWVGTFEYTNTRQVNAPNLSNFRVIIEKGMERGRDFTFNGSATIYDKLPVGMNVSRLRDFQIAAQFDQQLGEIQGIGKPVLSFSYQFKRQPNDVMMEGAMGMMMMPQTSGNIHIGQFKVTFPAKGTGVKIPISVTFANRSELIKESFVRGNVGLTFDFNTLFAKFKP